MEEHIIKYKSDGLLPKEIVESLDLMSIRIHHDQYELDKIHCHISKLRGDIIMWLSAHCVS